MEKVNFLIVEIGRYKLAKELNMHPATLNKKIKNYDLFTVGEINKIDLLHKAYDQH